MLELDNNMSTDVRSQIKTLIDRHMADVGKLLTAKIDDLVTVSSSVNSEKKNTNQNSEKKTEDPIEADVNAYAAREMKTVLGKLLITKAMDGDLDYVRYLLRLGPDKIDVNASVPHLGIFQSGTIGALEGALCKNHEQVALELLQCRDIAISANSCALECAVQHGLASVVGVILRREQSAPLNFGRSVAIAFDEKNIQILKLLLNDRRVDVSCSTKDGDANYRSPLIRAVGDLRSTEIVKIMLVRDDVNVNSKSDGMSALNIA
eukprot:197472_1